MKHKRMYLYLEYNLTQCKRICHYSIFVDFENCELQVVLVSLGSRRKTAFALC